MNLEIVKYIKLVSIKNKLLSKKAHILLYILFDKSFQFDIINCNNIRKAKTEKVIYWNHAERKTFGESFS